MSIVSCKKISFKYEEDKKYLFKNLSFNLERGQILWLSGKSGSGKTTLLYLLCRIIPLVIKGFSEGDIFIKRKNTQKFTLNEISKEIGFLWQNPSQQLFQPSVELELAFYPENLLIEAKTIKNKIKRILNEFEIAQLKNRDPAFLSFGEKKLVALASILTCNPDIFILDEPTTGLSKQKQNIVINKIRFLKEINKTIIVADNNPVFKDISSQKINISN